MGHDDSLCIKSALIPNYDKPPQLWLHDWKSQSPQNAEIQRIWSIPLQ